MNRIYSLNKLFSSKNLSTKQIGTFFCLLLTFLYISYSFLLIKFVSHDGLSSFASDSANYMVMARYLSPWHEATLAIQDAWNKQDFPVFFPFILALSGAAYNYIYAHILTAFFLILSLPFVYLFSRQILTSPFQAILFTIIFALSPAVWMNSLGILSENLYIFLSLIGILYFKKINLKNNSSLFILGLLFAALILTRTIGICLLAAYFLVSLIKIYKDKKYSLNFLYPVLVCLIIILVTKLFHNITIPEQYLDQLFNLVSTTSAEEQYHYNLSEQLGAIVDAWFVSWLYYWNNELALSYLIFALVGILALFGLVLRLFKNELDAHYLILYLFILLIWPHPGQAARFIYPVLFIILFHAFYALIFISEAKTKIKSSLINYVTLVIVLSSILPPLSYTWNRFDAGKTDGYHFYKEFYTIQNFKKER